MSLFPGSLCQFINLASSFVCLEGRQDSAMNLTTNGTNSINMSVELNGVVYTGTYETCETGS